MRLWYHAESDSLFLDEPTVENAMLCTDVSDDPAMRVAAKLRGIKFVYDAEVTSKQPRHTIADAIVKSYRRWERKPADLYPTPVDGTETIIPALQVLGEYAMLGRPLGEGRDQTKPPRVWEPACGDGRLSRVLEWHGFDVLSTDLRPHSGYGNVVRDRPTVSGGFDFLNDDLAEKWGLEYKPDMIVTNPPFSHAEPFIRKALTYTGNVAMLLKATYWNAASRLPFFHERRPAFVLPLTFRLAFLEKERGKSPMMECVWVIWSEANDPEDPCVFEPLPKRVYPGYAEKGIVSCMDILAGELDFLSQVVRDAATA